MASVEERFSSAAAAALREAIVDAGGNEVFALGVLADGLISAVRILARGNRHAAPAIMQVPRPGEVVVHNHPSGVLQPSDADLSIASALGNGGVGAYIVDNAVSALYVVVEPHRVEAPSAVDATAAAALLSPDGAVGAALDGFEERPQQLAMLRAVSTAFNDDGILSVEAGTGTGKSLAYLVPAILWSRANQQRVVISTHTINLQEQLVQKDLPLLTQRAGLEARVALVKGRGNYLCKRKAAQAEAQPAQLVEDELLGELRQVLEWAKQTGDGSLADLAVRPRPEVWEQVVSENDNCLRARCPFYSTCFFYSARRTAAAADIVVVNHHLLMADLALRAEVGDYTQSGVLPPSGRVIIDEAHHLEDVATSYFGAQVSLAMIERACGRLQSRRQPGKGILPALALALDAVDDPGDAPIATGAAHWIDTRLLAACPSIVAEAADCFEALRVAFDALPERRGDERVGKLRVTEAVRDLAFWRELIERTGRLTTALDAFAGDFEGVLERIARLSEEVAPQIRYLGTELAAIGGRLRGLAETLVAFVEEDRGHCAWIERRERANGVVTLSLHRAPIAVAAQLAAALFDPFATAVLTSATLTVDGRFDFLHQRVGVERVRLPERVESLRVASPFDFDRQALLVVPADLPEPNAAGHDAASHAAMRRILAATRGGTFLLFTSYGALNRAWFELANELRAGGYLPLRQGELSRQVLLRRFVADPRAVLFATDSFWEGVDVRGDALRCVVITRLPFRVPTEPLEEARVEAIAARGGDPFAEHALPQAAIKLQQGFGRLIRSRTDRGCVVILDSRIARKRYGQVFFASLPPARRVIGATREVLTEVDAFFASLS
ncbi:MAG TPA: helicase C-terminal domain-containing protein [Candidatus Dormibacteraeota bacterium]|nr:helicase C-terminal domain-containing protein [Candidatus Dormibacteraeota bacterium]